MATETTTLLIDVQVSASEALKRQQELKTSLEQQKEALKQLEIEQGKTSQAYIAQEATVKNLNNQLAANGRVLTQMAGTTTTVAGAYATLNQKSAEATQKAKDLAAAYGLNDARTKEAVISAKALSDQLKETDKELGQGTRFVGLYEEGFSGLKDTLGKFPTTFSQMKEGLASTAKGFMGVIKQMWLMVANPIGAIIAAIALALFGLYKVFKDFKPVVDLVEQSLAALGAIFEVVKNTVLSLFTGQKSLTESTKGLGKAMGDAAKEAMALKKAQQELEDGQASLEVQNKRAETQMQKLLLQSKNRTLSEKERMKLIDDAMKLETDIYNRKKKQNDDEVKTAENKIIVGKKLTASEISRLRTEGVVYARILQDKKTITDDEINSLKDALLKREDINQASIGLQEKAQNRRDALADAANEKEIKRQEEIKAANEKAQVEREKIDAKNQKAADEKLEAEKKAEDERLKALKEKADEEIGILSDTIKLAALKEQERVAGQKLTDEQIHANKLTAIETLYKDEKSKQDILLQQKQITQAEYDANMLLANQQLITDKAIQNADFEAAQAEIKSINAANMLQDQMDAQVEGSDAMYDLLLADLERERLAELAVKLLTEEEKKAINEKYAKFEQDLAKKKKDAQLSVAGDLASKIAEIAGKGTVIGKAAASAQVAIDTYKGAMSSWAAAQVYPAPFNAIVGGASVAATVALGAKSIKDIWAVKAPGASGGGGGSTPSVSTPTASAIPAAAITGGLASRNSGQTQQQATEQAFDGALKANPTQPVLVTNDLTTALEQKVQIKSDNSL